jgi:hypothetical protein
MALNPAWAGRTCSIGGHKFESAWNSARYENTKRLSAFIFNYARNIRARPGFLESQA